MQALANTLAAVPWRSHSTITRAAGLFTSRRGDEVLVVEPLTASWGVFSGAAWKVFLQTARPQPAAALVHAALAEGIDERQAHDLLRQMYHQGFIQVDGRPFRDPEELWKRPAEVPTFVSVHVLEGCNLRCSYCYADAGADLNRMERDLIFRVVEKSIREIPSDALTVDFLGGEPMLLFDDVTDAIRHGRDVATAMGKRVEFILQTNGTMLTRDKARVLRDLEVGVGVSLDGPKALHDRYRPRADRSGSWDEVYRNLLAAREEGLRVAPLAVIHEPATYTEVLQFFIDNGFEFLRFNYTSKIGRARDMLEFPAERAEAFASGFMDMVGFALSWCESNGRPLRINDLNQMIRVLATKNRDYMCMRSPCGLGDSIISFGTKGEIYACEEFERDTKARFMLGQTGEMTLPEVVASSPNYHLLKQRKVENIPKCSRCHLRYICGGGCTHKSLAYYGSHLREDPMCRYYQVVFEELMWTIWKEPRAVDFLGAI